MELERNLGRIRQAGLGLAAVSYDSVATLKTFADRQHITFPLLSDEGSRVIREFGILNAEAKEGTQFYGIPYPGTYILDSKGLVRAKYFEEDYRERDNAGLVLLRQFGIEPAVAHETRRGKHLSVSTSSSAPSVRANLKFELILDVTLDPKMHVYAPGVEGYIPVAWSMAESPMWKAAAPQFPASKMLHLAAIDETVPVFENYFRLTREVTIADEKTLRPLVAADGKITIDGSLRYQACDDRMCYLPESIPLKWALPAEALDRVRAKQ